VRKLVLTTKNSELIITVSLTRHARDAPSFLCCEPVHSEFLPFPSRLLTDLSCKHHDFKNFFKMRNFLHELLREAC
jgi:hypothetical protein